MLHRNNYNNNEQWKSSLEPNDNYNNNDIDKFDKSKKAETIAQKLVEKLNSKESYLFYCKVAYALPESKIWINLEQSLSGKNPGGLFNWLCRRDMGSGGR
jgi:hypothetical protein